MGFLRSITLILVGTALGATGGGVYGTLCSVLCGMIHGTIAPMISVGVGLAAAGAIAGAIVGVCRAIDRAMDKSEPLPLYDPSEGKGAAGMIVHFASRDPTRFAPYATLSENAGTAAVKGLGRCLETTLQED